MTTKPTIHKTRRMTNPTITEKFLYLQPPNSHRPHTALEAPSCPLRALIDPAARQTSHDDSKPDGEVAFLALQSPHNTLSHYAVCEMLYFQHLKATSSIVNEQTKANRRQLNTARGTAGLVSSCRLVGSASPIFIARKRGEYDT